MNLDCGQLGLLLPLLLPRGPGMPAVDGVLGVGVPVEQRHHNHVVVGAYQDYENEVRRCRLDIRADADMNQNILNV